MTHQAVMLLPLPRYFRGRLGGGHLTNAPSIPEHAAVPCRINEPHSHRLIAFARLMHQAPTEAERF